MGEKNKWKRYGKKIWHFLWHDDSAIAFVVNIVVAYLIIKFLLYPGIGLIMGTSYPIVAVVSGSMDHVPAHNDELYSLCGNAYPTKPTISSFDEWWKLCGSWYKQRGIDAQQFRDFSLHNGFRRGDLVLLVGAKNPKVGDVIVFFAPYRSDPIIHRVIQVNESALGSIYTTKGDNNPQSFPQIDGNIQEKNILGKGIFRIPYLGYVKIFAFELLQKLIGGV